MLRRLTASFLWVLLLAGVGWTVSWEEATLEFDRGGTKLEELRQGIEGYSAAIERVRTLRSLALKADQNSFDRFLRGAEASRDLVRSRARRLGALFANTREQMESERERSESCPACIVEAISMACGIADSLIARLAGEQSRLQEFQKSVHRLRDAGELVEDTRARLREVRSRLDRGGGEPSSAEAILRAERSLTLAEENLAAGEVPRVIERALEAREIVDRLEAEERPSR